MWVYKITNKLNGMAYIGMTTYSVSERFKSHCRKGSKCKRISNAIQKYGKENFNVTTLFEAKNTEELIKKEIFYISEYSTISPKGYNLSKGGDFGGTNKTNSRKVIDTESGKSWESARKCSAELKINYEVLVGKLNGTKVNYSNLRYAGFENVCKTNDRNGSKHYKSITVIDLLSDKSWGSLVECADELGYNKYSLYNKLSGTTPNETGLRIKGKEHICKSFSKINRSKRKPVVDVISGVIFNSVAEASRSMEIKSSTLGAMLRGENRNRTNLKFYYGNN